MWEVEFTDEFERWWLTLPRADRLYDEHLQQLSEEGLI